MIRSMANSIIFIFIIFTFNCQTSRDTRVDTVSTKENTRQSGCISGNCLNGYGIYMSYNGGRYEGQWNNGLFDGKGILFFPDVTGTYTGEFKKGSREGNGINIFKNGDRYEGGFFANMPNGKGVFIYADGTIERGVFSNGLFCGTILLPVLPENAKKKIGVIRTINPTSAEILVQVHQSEGEKILAMGQKVFLELRNVMVPMEVIFPMMSSAKCKMIGQTSPWIIDVRPNMPVYEMIKGMKRGDGTFAFPNGNSYAGEHRGNLMHGSGTFRWSNGTVYEGELSNGMRNGKGKLSYYHGDVFEGNWKNGMMHGKGELKFKNGDRYVGNFVYGRQTGKGKLYHYDGGTYEGDFKNENFEGKGIQCFPDGNRYEGEFINNKFNGKGTYYFNDQKTYFTGEFSNGKPNGVGKIFYNGKIIKEGRWVYGNHVGEQ